jgi:hypothetical protein
MDQVPELKGWKSYLLWEGLPFLVILSMFGILLAINWDYESKLITPDSGASDPVEAHLGLILLGIAMSQALIASVLLFIVRITRHKSKAGWYMFISLVLVFIFLVFPALFIVILAPAAITMEEQMKTTR